MIENEFHFSNPISLVLASSILGEDLKKASFIRFVENKRYLMDGNRDNNEIALIAEKLGEILGIEINQISLINHYSNPSQVIEATLKRTLSPDGQIIIMESSDIYCRFGFRNYVNFFLTKQKLRNLWRAVDYSPKDTLCGYFLEGTKTNLTCKVSDIDIFGVKKILREIVLESGYVFSNFFSINNNKKYLLVMPYRYDSISEDFSWEFFKEVNAIAKVKNLNIILKNHPNDDFNYAQNFSFEKDFLIMSNKMERHIPVELFLQSKAVEYTISVPSSSLAFAETNKLLILVPKNRTLYRKKFLDQEPFLDRLKLNVKKI